MIHFGPEDQQMLKHTAEHMAGRIACQLSYTRADDSTIEKLGQVAQHRNAVVITSELIEREAAADLIEQVVQAEINHWVPGSSQRLIQRAAAALGFTWKPGELFDYGYGTNGCDPWKGRPHRVHWTTIGVRDYTECSACGVVTELGG